ncbi:MAG: hypothetical protein EBR95_10410 [Verrucomicrobia bacterium]|nr:hypothetical protein [Verrucomicrobiota bacterium]
MIVSDDHAWFDYGFMGSKAVSTPHLDKLAAESRAFPRGYVTNSLCGPSLASMLTGRHVHRHGLTGSNDPFVPPAAAGAKGAAKAAAAKQKNAAFLEGRSKMIQRFQESPILPRILGEQGYVSLQTGKWWMGPYQTGGFTEGMTKGGRHGDEGLDIGRKTLAPLTDFISRAKKDGKPFFAWYAPMMPHDPHTPPERLLAKYRDKSPTPQAARYHAMVEWFDETIGEIRAHLEKEGLTRDTIILYVADNPLRRRQRLDPAHGQARGRLRALQAVALRRRRAHADPHQLARTHQDGRHDRSRERSGHHADPAEAGRRSGPRRRRRP